MPSKCYRRSPRLAGVILARSAILALLLLTGACATVDFDQPRDASYVIADTDDTHIGRVADEFRRGAPDESGFHMIIDGVDALGARVKSALRAERTIDLQYYLIDGDVAGAVLVDALLDAADRGVRVRVLIDDVLTKGQDRGMIALDAHPNVEVRIFNPFANRSLRAWNFLTDFNRVNRRMHNKSFIVDNQMAILGGRNIGDEYFAAREDYNFGDLDVVAIGPVVQEVSNMFDLYWNHRLSMPVTLVIGEPRDPAATLAAGRERLDEAMAKIHQTRYGELMDDFKERRFLYASDFTWVPYDLVYDSPDKAGTRPNPEAQSIRIPLREAVLSARSELIVLSPYFVPTDRLFEGFRMLRERGVEIIVITNSLAANNHSIVHSGYTPWRKRLLEIGVQLFETRPDAQATGVEKSGMARSGGTLHTKAFVVDRQIFYLGSFNWDPRSAYINTEMGLILNSPKFGDLAGRRMDAVLPYNTYRLDVDERGRLEWITFNGDERVVYTKEPETSWWKRFSVGVMGILPVDGQL